ncbi:MAG TPA: apolipoprotein N-acyltransferase [Aestuariivirgaceae bacterium]|nr:apolipoprotein N-acyltransferase [Aestuariivirgaceae bacterium]
MAGMRAEAGEQTGWPVRRLASRIAALSGARRLLASAAGGAIAALSLPPAGLWPALIVGLGVLIWLLDGVAGQHRSLKRRMASAALVGWSFGFGYFVTSLYWLGFAFLVEPDRFALLMPLGVAALPAGLALFWAGAAAGAIAVWQPGPRRAIALAVALAAGEWLRGHILSGFPWNAPGYAAGALDGLGQGAASVGLYGMTLLMLLWAGVAAVLASEALSRRALVGVALVLAAAPLALAAGHWRLAAASTAMFEDVSLRVVQANIAQGDKWIPEHRDEIVMAHLELSTSGGLAGVTHLVWPESAVPMLIDEAPQAREQLVRALPDHVTLLLGALRRELHDPAGTPSVRIYNSLFAVSGAGDILARYDKWRLVPFGEYLPFEALLKPLGLRQFVPLPLGFSAGPAPRTLAIEGTPGFAPLICYEAIFPRALIDRRHRPEWLLNVTNDGWFGNTAGPYQHLEQARFRAIEEGLALVRAANTGISAVIDPYGRILHRLPLGEAGRFDSPLPRPLPPTLYALWGDLPFFVLLVLAGLLAVAYKKPCNLVNYMHN